jgi:putative Holliday junction resolvase
VRLLALDYGVARTGVAVSDESGTLASPLTVVARAATEIGLAEIERLVRDRSVARVVVGLPLSLDGREHAQAREVRSFVARLAKRLPVPVVLYDERFTTTIAQRRGGAGALDARAAAALLEDYLTANQPT